MSKQIFSTIGEVAISTIGALFIVNSVLLQIGEVPGAILMFVGIFLLVAKKGLVKFIPEFGRFNDPKQDAIIGIVSGLFVAKGIYSFFESYVTANIAIAFLIGVGLVIFKEPLTKAIGGLYAKS